MVLSTWVETHEFVLSFERLATCRHHRLHDFATQPASSLLFPHL